MNFRIPHALNSVFLLKVFWPILGDLITLIIYLYYLRILPLADFSLRVFRIFEVWDLNFPNQIETDYVTASSLIFIYCVSNTLDIPAYFM